MLDFSGNRRNIYFNDLYAFWSNTLVYQSDYGITLFPDGFVHGGDFAFELSFSYSPNSSPQYLISLINFTPFLNYIRISNNSLQFRRGLDTGGSESITTIKSNLSHYVEHHLCFTYKKNYHFKIFLDGVELINRTTNINYLAIYTSRIESLHFPGVRGTLGGWVRNIRFFKTHLEDSEIADGYIDIDHLPPRLDGQVIAEYKCNQRNGVIVVDTLGRQHGRIINGRGALTNKIDTIENGNIWKPITI